MGKIHFYREYVDLAVKLMDAKSKIDDVKALKDVNEINFMLIARNRLWSLLMQRNSWIEESMRIIQKLVRCII